MKKCAYLFISLAAAFAAAFATSCGNDNPPEDDPTGEAKVVINEVYSRGKGSFYSGVDWVELHNSGTAAADIGGWVLSDKTDMSEKITIASGTSLAAGGFLKVEVDIDGGFGLSSGGDAVYLYDAEGEPVDSVEFGAMEENESWSAVPDGSDIFRLRAPTPGASNNNAGVNPGVSEVAHTPAAPAPGEAVTVSARVTAGEGTVANPVMLQWKLDGTQQNDMGMTAGEGGTWSATIPAQAEGVEVEYTVAARNSTGGETKISGSYVVRVPGESDYIGKVVVNEAYSRGKGSVYSGVDWVELHNTTDGAIDIGGFVLMDADEDPLKKVTIADGVSLAAGGFLLVEVDITDGFGLGSGGDAVVLYDPRGGEVDRVEFGAMEEYFSWSAFPDGSDNYRFQSLTPGASNNDGTTEVDPPTVGDYTGLVINEVDGNGKFVELYNGGTAAITLTGVRLVKNDKGTWWTGGAGITVAPGDYYTVAQEGGAEGADEYTGDGGISPKKNVRFELLQPDGVRIDIFTRSTALDLDADCLPDYGKTSPKYSFARCPDGTGAFGLAEPSADSANPAVSAGTIETSAP